MQRGCRVLQGLVQGGFHGVCEYGHSRGAREDARDLGGALGAKLFLYDERVAKGQENELSMSTPTPLLLREGKYLPTTSHVFRNTTREVLTITDDEIIATGTITASNINVINKVTTFNEVHIRNDSNTVPFTITHTGVDANIMEIGDEKRIGFVINNNGNVGIGAVAPVAPFHAVHAPVLDIAGTSNFTPYGLDAGTRFGEGHAVSEDGLSLFIGIPGSSQVSYIRRATLTSQWMPMGTILPNVQSQTAGSAFGTQIKVSNAGDALWVSATGIERLFRFDRNGVQWAQGLQLQRTVGDGGGGNVSYGMDFAVSSDGSNVVVGTPAASSSAGGFYLHSWSNGAWTASNITGGELGLAVNSYLGSAVDMRADGQWLFVGARGALGGSGAVFVYKSVGAGYRGYSNVQTLLGDAGMLQFGRSISVSGEFVAIGAQANVVVYKYGLEQAGVWSRYQTILAPMGTASFGTSVSLDANGVLLVGDPVNNVHGEVRVFTHNTSYFQEMVKISPTEVEAVGYGQRVSIGAGSIIIVAHGYGLDNRGLLYVIETNYSEKDGICVQTDANVGIGTTTPASKLEVFGDVNIVGTLKNYGVPIGYGSLGTARNTLQVAPYRFVHEVSSVASSWSYVLDGRYVVSADKTDVFVNGVKLLYMSVAGGIRDYSVSYSNADDKTYVTLSLRDAPAYNDFVEVVFWPSYAQLDGTNNFGVVFQTFKGLFENASDGSSNIYYVNGNVGIGTVTPKAGLHVQNQSTFGGNVGVGTTVPLQSLHVQNKSFFLGNVGVGTTVPRQLLDVQGGDMIASGNIGVGTTAPIQSLHVGRQSYFNSNVGIGTTVPRQLLDVQGGNAIVIGSIGIGTTTPAQALSVQGNAYISGNISAGNLGLFRNRIINGDMRIAQRGTTSNISASTAVSYVIDRFAVAYSITTGGLKHEQLTLTSSDTPYQYGFRYSYRVTASTANTNYAYIYPNQKIEGNNLTDLMWGTAYGVPITLSLWLKTNIATNGVVTITFRNGAYNYSYNINVSVAASGSWQFVSQTVPAPPSGSTWAIDNTTMLDLGIGGYQAAGLTANVNTWENLNRLGTTTSTNIWATLNNYIEFTGVQLEKGNIATPFEFRPYSVELQLCQRYCVRFNAYGVYSRFGVATGNTAALAYAMIYLQVAMRAIASTAGVTYSSLALQAGTIVAVTTLTINASDTTPTCFAATANVGSGLTAGSSYVLIANNTTNAYIQIDADL